MRLEFPQDRYKISGQFGWLARVTWGHGLFGKATLVIVALFGVLAVVAWRVPSEWAMLAVGGTAVIVAFGFMFFLSHFAKKYPALERIPIDFTHSLRA